jgi:hypothetical protein
VGQPYNNVRNNGDCTKKIKMSKTVHFRFIISGSEKDFQVTCPYETPFKFAAIFAARNFRHSAKVRKILPAITSDKTAREIFLRSGNEFVLEIE